MFVLEELFTVYVLQHGCIFNMIQVNPHVAIFFYQDIVVTKIYSY